MSEDARYTLTHPRDYHWHVRDRSPMHIVVFDSGRTLCGIDPSKGIWDAGIEDMALTPENVVASPRVWCARCWRSFGKRHPELAGEVNP